MYFLLVAHSGKQRSTVLVLWQLSISVTVSLQIGTRAVTEKNSHQRLGLELAMDNFKQIPAAFIVFKVSMLKLSATIESSFACAVSGTGQKSGIISDQGLP